MHVLVTGGSGFLGAYVVRDLISAGHEVVGTDLRPDDLLQEVVVGDLGPDAMPPTYRADISDVTGLLRICRRHSIDAIVHTAGLLSEGCEAAPAHAAMVNVVGTGTMFELAVGLSIDRFVWTSSISVFGYVASDRSVPDDAPHDPTNFYGLYKSTNERQAALYYDRMEVPSTGIRIGFAYGFGRERGRGAWTHELLAKPAIGLPGRVWGGDVLVPWLYVEDAAAAIVAALLAEPVGARVFNTQGTPRWKHEAVDCVRRLLPDADVELVGEPEGYPTGLDDHTIREQLEWEPVYTLEQGVSESIDRYRRRAGLPPLDHPDLR